MKKIILILMSVLILTACAQQEPTPDAAVSSAGEIENAPKDCTEETFVPPDGQERAIDAYQEIMDFFVTPCPPEDPDYPGYPDDFADAYIGEDYYLYVCLTDTEGPGKMKYFRAVKEPRILKFVEVKHSYNDLYNLQMAVTGLEGWDFASVGINVRENRLDIGIPDIGAEEQVRQLFASELPSELLERFGELPLFFTEEDYVTFGVG